MIIDNWQRQILASSKLSLRKYGRKKICIEAVDLRPLLDEVILEIEYVRFVEIRLING